MFKKGKIEGIKEQLEGYEKMNKADIKAGEGILIDNVIKGFSQDNGDFIYVTGSYEGRPVFVSVPVASLDLFMDINANDVEYIRRDGLKMYVESRISKSNRQYFVAWIDD